MQKRLESVEAQRAEDIADFNSLVDKYRLARGLFYDTVPGGNGHKLAPVPHAKKTAP